VEANVSGSLAKMLTKHAVLLVGKEKKNYIGSETTPHVNYG